MDVDFAPGIVGPVTITVEAFYDCASATSSIVVDETPEMPTVTPNVFCAGAEEQPFASSPGSNMNYTWVFTGAFATTDTTYLTSNGSNYYVNWPCIFS